MKYSLIIPCWNPPESFEHCLQAAINNCRRHDGEVLLICTAENAAFQSALKWIGPKDNVKIFYEEERGVCASRNAGLRYASGEFVLFCDSDDWIDDALFFAFEALEDKPDLFCYGFYKEYGSHTEQVVLQDEDLMHLAACQPGGGLAWNKIIRREFLLEHNLFFDESLKLAEDIEWVLRLAACKPEWQLSDKCLHHYAISKQSVSQRFRTDMPYEYLKSMQAIAKNPQVEESFKKQIYFEHLLFTAMKYSFRPYDWNRKQRKEQFYELAKTQPYASAMQGSLQLSLPKKLLFLAVKYHQSWLLLLAGWAYSRR